MSIFKYEAVDIHGKTRTLEEFKGKKVLIVNTASKCGLTPQYKELQRIYNDNSEQLEILAFPCNQFGNQEPGESSDIEEFCNLRFNITFPLFEKLDVNGSSAHPLFKYLKKALPGTLGVKTIKWNFTKFLIDEDGTPIKRFSPTDSPKKILKYL